MGIDTVRKTLPITYSHLDAIMKEFAVISTKILEDHCPIEMGALIEPLKMEITAALKAILEPSTYYGMQITNGDKIRTYIVGDAVDKIVIAFDDFVLNSTLDDDIKLTMITRMHINSIPMRVRYEHYSPGLKDYLRRHYETEKTDSESENDSDDEWNII